ncbi:MAG: RNA methyltransferase [Kiritimatiellia bacterium]
MLTAAQRKDIVALQRKKERDDRRQFLVEGPKLVEELLASGWAVDRIVAVAEWAEGREVPCPLHVVPPSELERVSAMEAPNRVLAVARMPAAEAPPAASAGLVLALDGIQDPGNLGTILRTADWFAVEHMVASPDCADRFNPKVVQASMGAVFHVPLSTVPLAQWLGQLPAAVDIAGAFLGGENVCRHPRHPRGPRAGQRGPRHFRRGGRKSPPPDHHSPARTRRVPERRDRRRAAVRGVAAGCVATGNAGLELARRRTAYGAPFGST